VPVLWTDTTVSTEVRSQYERLIQELLEIPYNGGPIYLELSPKAKECWVAWHDAHCTETEDPCLSSFKRASYSKLLGICPRLALIHTVVTDPQAITVELPSVEAAIQLTSYFKGQVSKVEPLVSRQSSAIERCKDEIRRKLSVCRYPKRTLQKNSAYPAEIFNEALKELLLPEIKIDGENIVSLRSLNN